MHVGARKDSFMRGSLYHGSEYNYPEKERRGEAPRWSCEECVIL